MEYWILGIILLWAIGLVIFGVYNLLKGASVVTHIYGLPQEKSGSLMLLELNDNSIRVKNISYKTERTIPFSIIIKAEVIHHEKVTEKQMLHLNRVISDNGTKKVTKDHYFLSIDYINKDGNYENALFLPDSSMSMDKYSGLAQIQNFSVKLNAKIGYVYNY